MVILAATKLAPSVLPCHFSEKESKVYQVSGHSFQRFFDRAKTGMRATISNVEGEGERGNRIGNVLCAGYPPGSLDGLTQSPSSPLEVPAKLIPHPLGGPIRANFSQLQGRRRTHPPELRALGGYQPTLGGFRWIHSPQTPGWT